MKNFVLGIDVGGTNIKLGIVDKFGHIIARSGLITATYMRDKNKLISYILSGSMDLLIKNGLKTSTISGIGIGLPGLIDPEKGVVNSLTNIPGWKKIPLKKIIEQEINIPTFIENDVNLITLGEWKFGAGVGLENMVCITLGTGVGGGLILNNKLYRGAGFAAGEVGHIPSNEKGPKCNCGGWGCLERYVGNQYLNKKAAKIFKNKKIKLEDVYALAVKGNKEAIKFWEETAIHIGNALTGVVNLINPTHIIIGGGVSKSRKFMFRTIQATIKARAMKVQGNMIKIIGARLGNDAGIVGARGLVEAGLNREL